MRTTQKILVAIPCLTGAAHVREAIESVFNKSGVDLLLFDNGAEQDVKDVLDEYEKKGHRSNYNRKVKVFHVPQNIYVNPAWDIFLNYFISMGGYYSHLIIMNSDLIMQQDWFKVVRERWRLDPQEVLIPIMTQDRLQVFSPIDTEVKAAQLVHEGTAGVFITLSREQARIVYPLPSEHCKIWFGDQFIYTILRELGYKTVIPENLLSYHYWSQTVQKVAGISELIEEDKRQWEAFGREQMQFVINSHK